MRFLFIDFLNSEWRDGVHADSLVDRLDQPGWMETVLAEWGIDVKQPPDESELRQLKELRAWLKKRVVKLARGGSLDRNDLNRLNAWLESVPVYRRLIRTEEGYRLGITPVNKDWNGVMSSIVTSFVDLLIRHDPGRLRICENPCCLWFFYDESRNRSRRWCDHRTCGNLMNVRRFRERRRRKPEDRRKGKGAE